MEVFLASILAVFVGPVLLIFYALKYPGNLGFHNALPSPIKIVMQFILLPLNLIFYVKSVQLDCYNNVFFLRWIYNLSQNVLVTVSEYVVGAGALLIITIIVIIYLIRLGPNASVFRPYLMTTILEEFIIIVLIIVLTNYTNSVLCI